MSDFDRLAWVCSWVAPAGWLFGLAALAFSFVGGGVSEISPSVNAALPVLALAALGVALVAHTILTYHVQKARWLTAEVRTLLWRDFVFGFGYGRWRSVMRTHQR